MQIQLVIGEQDSRYLNNLVLFMEKHYMDQVEIISFSTPEMLMEYIKNNSVQVILLDENFGMGVNEVKPYGAAALLCDSSSGFKQDIKCIEKYKKPELIFKDILDLYAESGGRGLERKKSGENSGEIILVTSFSGGTGASTVAAASSVYDASLGKKTLFLNLEKTGASSDFFTGEGNYRFEDIIYALKSKRTDVRLKMNSCVRQDKSGVYFFEPCSTAMYMLELSDEDQLNILTELEGTGEYQKIIVDMDFSLSEGCLKIMNTADKIIVVNDGTETANTKFMRTYQALLILEEQMGLCVTDRLSLLYNRFSSSKSSSEITGLKIPVLGTFPPIKHARVHEIMELLLSKKEIFEKLG